ncbi:MAG: GIY-YIG nuclease family protein, partial [Ignavibacteria bacterium]
PSERSGVKMGFVYILQSKLNQRYYIGSTLDVEHQFIQHQSGLVASTKHLRPLELKYYQKYETLKQARQIEYKLKKLKSRKIIEQIIQDKIIKLGL